MSGRVCACVFVCLCACVVVESMWAINIRRWVHSCSCSHSFSFTLSFSVVSCLQTTDDGLSLSLFLTPCLSHSHTLSLSRSLAHSLSHSLSCCVHKRPTTGSLYRSLFLTPCLSHSLTISLACSLALYRVVDHKRPTTGSVNLSLSLLLFYSLILCGSPQTTNDGFLLSLSFPRAHKRLMTGSFSFPPSLSLSLALSLSCSLALLLSCCCSLALLVFSLMYRRCVLCLWFSVYLSL